MQNGICPKCSSPEVYYSAAKGGQHGLNETSYVRIFKEKKWVPDITLLEFAYYLCRGCGYFEMYAQDLEKLAALEDCSNWRKVGHP